MRTRSYKSRVAHHSSLNELNITPLLDLVFVLLVIFIITTPQLTNSLEINLPSGKPQPAKPKVSMSPHRIVIAANGQIALDKTPISRTALKDQLSILKASNPGLAVVVESSDEAEYQQVINVFDLLQQLEIKKVGLATEAVRQ